ncbi:MAG: BatA domain-containing protein [Gammaproteobacteria bacterium]|nr:BatA domain-containing protein [Gammaproteobacteria bacterium]MCY4166602.1 BatA domain-containing protein [Gammaproteobacteria bacterium]MCY4341804.1 BatA domain-containing protein [Gammaproteobacteria bacterium]
MNFANLSWPWLLAGAAGLAGLLYVLQQLRIRYTEVAVPTAMFWREAARDAPVRVFRRRFRHWLAYLLSLLICWLLWLGLAEPRVDDPESGQYYVLFLDGSAHMSAPGALERAIESVRDDLRSLPDDQREVIWGGARNLKLLNADEESLLFDRRVDGLMPEGAPSAVEEQLDLLALPGAYPESVRLIIYGRAPVSAEVLDGLPEGVQVQRAQGLEEPGPNRGIVAMGLGTAASGRWDAVDVLVRLEATGNLSTLPGDVELSLDGAPLSGAVIRDAPPDGFVLRDIPTAGGLLEVRLSEPDALPADNVAQLRLPERRQFKVAVSATLGSVLVDAVQADPGLMLAGDDPEVVFRRAGEAFGGDLSAVEFAPMNEQEAAFEIQYTGNPDAESALRDSLQGLGLNLIDGAGLAAETGRPVSVQTSGGESKSISVWLELLDERFNFTVSRAFPLFVSRAARWLIEEDAVYSYLAAGRLAPDESSEFALTGPGDSATRLLGADLPPARSGTLEAPDGGLSYPVSLLSTAVTTAQTGVELPAFAPAGAGLAGPSLLALLLILAALALLALEWYAYQRGMMP